MATARFTLDGQDYKDIPILNPGEWFGTAYLIKMYHGSFGERYVVEAGSELDALDEFVDREQGRQLVITEPDLSDYDPEALHYAGNASEPVYVDNVSITAIPHETLRYDDIIPSQVW